MIVRIHKAVSTERWYSKFTEHCFKVKDFNEEFYEVEGKEGYTIKKSNAVEVTTEVECISNQYILDQRI